MGKFEFNGKTSEDFGLVIQTPPTYEYPERDMSVVHIPGRNGDVIIDNKCFKNVQRTYSIGVKYYQSSSYYLKFEEILNWLNSAKGKYVKLEDSYDSDVYRLASFQSSGSFTDYFGKGGVGTITFECKPQRFLKVGEKETEYHSNRVEIVNDSNYESKPTITINGIQTDLSTLLMFSVIDKNGKSTSSIAITNYDGDMIFDSENDIVTNQNGDDLNDKVNLNSTPFPKLKNGKNIISVDKFVLENSTVNSYSSILSKNQITCLSEYKTYAALEQTAQQKIFVKSYKALISSKQESYLADSVQSYVSSVSSAYTFESYNTLLSDYGQQYTFTGSASENESTKPDWLDMTDSGSSVLLYARDNGFFVVGGKDKKIFFRKAGDSLVSGGLSPNSVNTITYFQAEANPENVYGDTAPAIDGVPYGIVITYSDMPDWLNFAIEYDFEGCPCKIHYMKTKQGYYWTDKSWIFGKAQWKYYSDDAEVILASLNWNTSKKAFVNTSGLSLSTTSTFTYRYSNSTPTNLPEYKDIETVTVDDRGVSHTEIQHKVHFTIIDIGAGSDYTLSNVSVKAIDNGYYSYQIDGGEQSSWVYKNQGDIIVPTISGTKTFGILYLENPPDYSNEEDWPEWLDPTPMSSVNLLTADKIWFKVLAKSNYRVSEGPDDDTPQKEGWVSKEINDNLSDIMSDKTVNDAMYIYKLDEVPIPFDYNRSYTINSGEPQKDTPEWLNCEIDPSGIQPEDTPEKLKYKAGKSGYFRWDTNTSWVYYEVGDDLIEIGGKDDCVFYYLEDLPSYEQDDFSNPSMFNLFDISVKQSPNPGNPKEVEFTVKQTGYYRSNNSTSWKYLVSGDTAITSKIGDMIRLYHLVQDINSSSNNVTIKIKPRWWKL